MSDYPEMKDSDVEWIGEIPKHWKVSKFKYQFRFGMGETILKENLTENGVPVLSATEDYSILGYYDRPKLILEKGDLVIPARGSIGFVKVVREKSVSTQTTIYGKKTREIDTDFVKLFCEGYKQFLFQYDQTAIPQITVAQVENKSVLVPPLEEQKLIAAYLDEKTGKIDSLIEKIRKKIELLKEQRTSLINRCVTRGLDPNVEMKASGVEWIGKIPKHWTFGKIRWLIDSIKDGTHGTYKSVDEGKILLSSKNVHDGHLKVTENERMISIEDHKQITKNGYPTQGDVLVSSVGSVGRSCVFGFDEPISFQRSVCFIRPLKKINPYFLSYAIRSNACQGQIVTLINRSTVGGIYMGDLTSLVISFPPLEEQKLIAGYLDEKTGKIDSLIEKIQNKIKFLKEYRQSLVASVVTGKVRVTEGVS